VVGGAEGHVTSSTDSPRSRYQHHHARHCPTIESSCTASTIDRGHVTGVAEAEVTSRRVVC